jgi:hypothetical protein
MAPTQGGPSGPSTRFHPPLLPTHRTQIPFQTRSMSHGGTLWAFQWSTYPTFTFTTSSNQDPFPALHIHGSDDPKFFQQNGYLALSNGLVKPIPMFVQLVQVVFHFSQWLTLNKCRVGHTVLATMCTFCEGTCGHGIPVEDSENVEVGPRFLFGDFRDLPWVCHGQDASEWPPDYTQYQSLYQERQPSWYDTPIVKLLIVYVLGYTSIPGSKQVDSGMEFTRMTMPATATDGLATVWTSCLPLGAPSRMGRWKVPFVSHNSTQQQPG